MVRSNRGCEFVEGKKLYKESVVTLLEHLKYRKDGRGGGLNEGNLQPDEGKIIERCGRWRMKCCWSRKGLGECHEVGVNKVSVSCMPTRESCSHRLVEEVMIMYECAAK